jgi:hypothetical protein
MNHKLNSNHPLPAPSNQIPVESKFYIDRDIQKKSLNTLKECGALLKVVGKKKYGKTNFLHQIINLCKNDLSCEYVFIDLKIFQSETINEYEHLVFNFLFKILKSCNVLNYPFEIEKLWNEYEALDYNVRFENILEDYVLKNTTGLIIIIDDIDLMFNDLDIATNFYKLLRSIHEKGSASEIEQWGKLKIVLSYAIAKYISLIDPRYSPFNVGEEFILKEFSTSQVSQLALAHDIKLDETILNKIKAFVGNHPYLTRIFLYEYYKLENKDEITKTLYNVEIYHSFLTNLRNDVWGINNERGNRNNLLISGIINSEGSNSKYTCGLYEEYFNSYIL